MGTFEIASILITLAAIFSFINFKYLWLPPTIGIMLLSVATSLALIVLGVVALPIRAHAQAIVAGIDFHKAIFHGMLAMLLFAGSLHLEFGDLRREWKSIAVLSLLGTAVSTLLVGLLTRLTFQWIGLTLPPMWCLAFGALISPTDPIAVLAIMKRVGAPRSLETVMAGESLFNDGVGVAIFLAVAGVVAGGAMPTWSQSMLLLVREAAGGAGVGLASGIATYLLLRQVDNYQVEVMLTLALAMGGYTLADSLGVSAPIAIVVAGLFTRNRGRTFAMSEKTRGHLDTFWELIDEILNAVLFLLVGLEMLVVPFHGRFIIAGLFAIVLVLLSRWVSVAGSLKLISPLQPIESGRIAVLTWGGLRGGLSLAMALSLPESDYRNLILAITYAVVVFCVLVQGLSAGAVTKWAVRGRST